jgi:hypothetical protein
MHAAARRSGFLRSPVLGLAVVFALTGCIGGELGTPSTETTSSTPLTLTADHPVVTRSLDFEAKPGAQPVQAVDGYINVASVGDPPYRADVWISILDLETGDSIDQPDGIGSASIDGSGHHAPCDGKPALDAGEPRSLPVPPCKARWTVIARWLDAAPGGEVLLALNASLRAYANPANGVDLPFTLDTLAVTDAGVPLPVDGPAVTRRDLRGSTTLTPSSGLETHRAVLHVPRSLLAGRETDLRLGRIFAGIDLKERSPSISMKTVIRLEDEVVASATAPTSFERDWLARCAPDSNCVLPITVTFEPISASQVATMAPDAVVSFDWRIEARFEDFGEGATLPAELDLREQ